MNKTIIHLELEHGDANWLYHVLKTETWDDTPWAKRRRIMEMLEGQGIRDGMTVRECEEMCKKK